MLVGVGFFLLILLLGLYLVSGLLVPPVAVAVLFAIWVALFILAIRWRKRPWHVVMIPAIGALAWFTIVQGGSWLFGWTA